MGDEAIQGLMASADTNNDGVIQFSEFRRAASSLLSDGYSQPRKSAMPALRDVPVKQFQSYMERLFKIGDKDGNGVLDSMELAALLCKSGFIFEDHVIDQIMDQVDTNHDGVIQYREFCNAMSILYYGIA